MSEGYNKVMLLGNLGADPEVRFTAGGTAVLNLRLATTESYLDKDKVRREKTNWHMVVMFGKRGESLAKCLGKGSSIFVEGSLQTSSYEGKDGVKRYKTEVHAANIVFAGGRRNDGDGGPPPDEQGPPQRNGGGGGGGYQNRGGAWSPAGGGGQQQNAPPPQAPAGASYPDDFSNGYEDPDSIPF
jgi:single-strand DNA-binding protein